MKAIGRLPRPCSRSRAQLAERLGLWRRRRRPRRAATSRTRRRPRCDRGRWRRRPNPRPCRAGDRQRHPPLPRIPDRRCRRAQVRSCHRAAARSSISMIAEAMLSPTIRSNWSSIVHVPDGSESVAPVFTNSIRLAIASSTSWSNSRKVRTRRRTSRTSCLPCCRRFASPPDHRTSPNRESFLAGLLGKLISNLVGPRQTPALANAPSWTRG